MRKHQLRAALTLKVLTLKDRAIFDFESGRKGNTTFTFSGAVFL